MTRRDNDNKMRVLYLLRIAKNKEVDLMSETILDRMNFYYLIMLLTKKINLRRKERKKNKTKLLYTVNNPIELMPSLRKLASEF